MDRGPRAGRGDNLIDRDPQNLPVPIGGFSAVRRRRRPSSALRWWRRNAPAAIATLGVTAALLGAWLAWTRPSVPVYRYGDTIHVGASVLTATAAAVPGVSLYTGDAAMAIVSLPDGRWRGTAVTTVLGQPVSGRCDLARASVTRITESCVFTMAANPGLTATDELDTVDGPIWHRRYSDGATVDISVPSVGGVVPVPLPIGKP